MDIIIGLGKAGCNVAKAFEKYPQYGVYTIATGKNGAYNHFNVEKQNNIDDYEANCPDLSDFFRFVKGEVLFVTSGASEISAMSLSTLQQIAHKCSISVLYVLPNTDLLGGDKKVHERAVFNVFQEYARSGVFKRLYVVGNDNIEQIIGDMSILELHDKVNEVIVTTIHMINVFDNSEPIVSTFTSPHEISRICTFGIVDPDSKEDKMFFDLKNMREKRLYYAIPQKALESDKRLKQKIVDTVQNMNNEGELFVSYGVFPTNYMNNYLYTVSYSSQIQKNEKRA